MDLHFILSRLSKTAGAFWVIFFCIFFSKLELLLVKGSWPSLWIIYYYYYYYESIMQKPSDITWKIAWDFWPGVEKVVRQNASFHTACKRHPVSPNALPGNGSPA